MLTVGQKLWWVGAHSYNKGEREATVLKVGRKWATLDVGEYRIDLETLRADGRGSNSPGRCWMSEAEWRVEEARKSAWREFRDKLQPHWYPPDGVDIERIKRAAAALGIEV